MAMMIRLRPALALTLAWLPAACAPWPQWDDCPAAGCDTSSTGEGSGGATTPTSGGGIQTVTGNGDDDSTGSTSSDQSTTTGEPAEPMIVTFELAPSPILFNGPIDVVVSAEHAEGVRMELDTGDVIELAPAGPGVFSGEIAVLTGLLNGPHLAQLTPWRDGADGDTVEAPYEITLPEPGSQGLWETGDLIGAGQVAAMGVLPGGEIVELGTLATDEGPRCYLRRRSKGGAWSPADVATILPDMPCDAIDLTVDEQGTMFVVVNREGIDGVRWWLGKVVAWGQEPATVGVGTKGETAVAVAHHASSEVAVCGYAPTPMMDDDAMVWVYRPNEPGETRAFDYMVEGGLPHKFYERTRDCVYAGDTLTLVGEAHGPHGDDIVVRDRLFILGVGAENPTVAWTIAPAGAKTQSSAQAVDVDDDDRLVVAGYTCGDVCQPEGDLRIYDRRGDLAWQASLGTFPTKQFGTRDLAWSPAGYAVVATGGMKGNEVAFTVRAFTPSKLEPVWTFTRKDDQVIHVALALAIGHYGEVYAGGLGTNGYPAVAYIGG